MPCTLLLVHRSIVFKIFFFIFWNFFESVMRSAEPYTNLENVILRKRDLKWFGQKNQYTVINRNMYRALLATFWCKSEFHLMILCTVIVKNMSGIPQTECLWCMLCYPHWWLVCRNALWSVNVSCSNIFKKYFQKFQEILPKNFE